MRRLTLTLAVAAAVTLAATRAADPTPPAGELGVYFGWSAGELARLQLLADPCPAPDAPVSLGLGGNPLAAANAALGLPVAASALFLTGPAAPLASAHSVAFTCRAGGAGAYPIGEAALVELPAQHLPTPTLVARAADPADGLAARLLMLNGDREVVLEAIEYAPSAWETGAVLAAAGSRAQIGLLERVLRGESAVPAAAAPPAPSPWDAGYFAPDDPRALRPRRAEALDLRLGPGEAALILIEQTSLARSLFARTAVLYPVVTLYEPATGARQRLGFDAPVVGVTRSWLSRSGG